MKRFNPRLWTKTLPLQAGLYWCSWKTIDGFKTSICSILHLGPYGPAADPRPYDRHGKAKFSRIVHISDRGGDVTIHRGERESDRMRQSTIDTTIRFYKIPLLPPPGPHERRKRCGSIPSSNRSSKC